MAQHSFQNENVCLIQKNICKWEDAKRTESERVGLFIYICLSKLLKFNDGFYENQAQVFKNTYRANCAN